MMSSRDNVAGMSVDTTVPTYSTNGNNYPLSSGQDSTTSYYGNSNNSIHNQQQNASYQDRNVYQQQMNNRDSPATSSSSYLQQQQQQQHLTKQQSSTYPLPNVSAYQQGVYNSVAATAARRHIQQGYDDYHSQQQQLSPEEQFSPVSPENEVSLPYGIGSSGGVTAQQYQQQQIQLQQQQQQLQQQQQHQLQQQGERSGSDSSDDVSLADCLNGVDLMNLRQMPLLDENGQVLIDDSERPLMLDDQYCSEQQVYYTLSSSAPTPSDVYTILEDEDELSSPTGADGVTSLRKQQLTNQLNGQYSIYYSDYKL